MGKESLLEACAYVLFGAAVVVVAYFGRRWALLAPKERHLSSMVALSPLRIVFGPKFVSRTYLPGMGMLAAIGCGETVFAGTRVAEALGVAIADPVGKGVAIAYLTVALVSWLAAAVVPILGRPMRWMLVWPDPVSFEDLSGRMDRGDRFPPT